MSRRTILGKKLGMTQIFDRVGNAIPVTLIQAGPCTVLQVKTKKRDGYNSIQLGFDEKKPKRTNKPQMAHFEKAGTSPKRFIREARVDNPEAFQPGQLITAGVLRNGDLVDVTGISKGKGFAGVMKRHGFAGFSATHGTHESFRGPGSIGAAADPARVFKGKKMPGQMGDETVTVQNLEIIDVREAQNLIAIKGPVPGGKNGYLVISESIKNPTDAPFPVEPAAPEPEPEQEDPAEPDTAADSQVDAEVQAPVEPDVVEPDVKEETPDTAVEAPEAQEADSDEEPPVADKEEGEKKE